MKTTDVTFEDLSASVMVVPPLARHADLTLNRQENKKLIDHIEAGGIRTLMYGGNANFYNLPLSEYAETLAFLAEAVSDSTWLIPSAGPDFGRLMDQAALLREMWFPTVMALPQSFPATPAGVEIGLGRFAERLQRPFILYIKSESYLSAEGVQRLVDDGFVCAIKYAVVRPDPEEDRYLRQLLDRVDCRYLLSGRGERPAIVHLRDFGLSGFTSGSGAIAPRASARLLQALKDRQFDRAEEVSAAFLPLEDWRETVNPMRVLHDAVTLAGLADMGPILPLMHNLEEQYRAPVKEAARTLRAYDSSFS